MQNLTSHGGIFRYLLAKVLFAKAKDTDLLTLLDITPKLGINEI